MKKLFPYSLTAILILAIALSGCGGGTPPASFSIAMSRVPGAASFPTGIDDSGACNTVNYPYYIAQTEVTYQLWSTVHTWAGSHGYTFANPGSRGGGINKNTFESIYFTSGHDTDPVTTINWRDAIVWCNALTEYYNTKNKTSLDCAYKDSDGVPIRDSQFNNSVCDNLTDDGHGTKGFRLPTSMEWELATRYRGNDSTNAVLSDGIYYTKGNSASGATGPYTDADATKLVAWYTENSNVPDNNVYSTQPVGKKTANALGLYDMSGNVVEWCFDLNGFERVYRHGTYLGDASYLPLGRVDSYLPGCSGHELGFRPVRTE